MPGRFLAIGECMVELADIGGGNYRRGFAGDTFNTAWYARRLLPDSWKVGYLSAIGEDAVSDEMKAFMDDQGVETNALRRIPDRTVGLYMISIKDGERSFSYWRSQSAARCLADDPGFLGHQIADADVVYFSGITLAILTPERRRALRDALAAARARGARIAFDTNLRPRLWESPEAMREGILMGASVADIVLPSLDEEAILFGSGDADNAINRYRECGARTIAAKNGGADLVLWDETDGIRSIAAEPVLTVVDTTAAGDSFGAGFVSSLATGDPVNVAARKAMQLAAQVIQHRGALVPDIFRVK